MRESKGPRTGVSAEAYGLFNQFIKLESKKINKTEEQIMRIKSSVLQSVILSNLSPNEILVVVDAMRERKFNAGDTVIRQGDAGDELFFVESGELECYKTDVPY